MPTVIYMKSFTLVELLVVVIIVGILAALGLPGYRVVRERVLDREAKINLALVRGAERISLIESGAYYASSVISDINAYLKVNLPTTALTWDYVLYNDRATATRKVTSGRIWTLFYTGSSTASCTGIECPP